MEYVMTESEQEQLRRFALMQKLSLLVLAKWGLLLAVVFIFLASSFSAWIVRHTARSGHRYSAVASLMYNPRQVAHISNMSDKQLMQVLCRRSLKRKVGDELELPLPEMECLSIDLDIVQERHPSNLFTLTARAPSRPGAVAKVNAYAAVLMREYVAYRTRDLENWRDSIIVRKQSLLKQIAELESEESTLKASAGVVAPVESLTMVNALLSDQRRNQSDLGVQIANEEARCKRLESTVGNVGRVVAAHSDAIRRRSEEIVALDAEIAGLREIYTDANPKVAGKLEERKRMMSAYTAFLAQYGISDLDMDSVERIAESAEELAETNTRLSLLRTNLATLERSIESNEKKAGELTAVIPAFERLRVRRTDLETIMRSFDEQLENITYLEMSIASDLRQIERTDGADGKNPFRSKNFIIATAGALFGTSVLFFWILALELAFGRVSSGREIELYDTVRYVGSMPRPGSMGENVEKDVLGVISLRIAEADVPNGVVLVSLLPGAQWHPQFWDTLDWTLSMAGRPSFVLDIVVNSEFEPPDDAENLVNTVVKGQHGWFPVDNRYTLAPTELQILQADLQQLHSRYDFILVRMPSDIRRGGSFYDQLVGVCDSVLLGVGIGKTPRSWFAYARNHVASAGKPAMAVALGERARRVHREMEAKK